MPLRIKTINRTIRPFALIINSWLPGMTDSAEDSKYGRYNAAKKDSYIYRTLWGGKSEVSLNFAINRSKTAKKSYL